jgi:HSP20 family protein
MNDTRNSVVKNESEKEFIPYVDISETVDSYILNADMPGVSKENLDITLDNNTLIISGKVDNKTGDSYEYQEFELRNYKRSFVVNEEMNTKDIDAKLENGVLTLHIPKSEKTKPRKIEIKAAS